ncbi:MAG TPA: hypothetical protein VKR31_00375 [Rhizomicrobium sp.]|nr:hypothetical protein [Rhizomicrobium sp.]
MREAAKPLAAGEIAAGIIAAKGFPDTAPCRHEDDRGAAWCAGKARRNRQDRKHAGCAMGRREFSEFLRNFYAPF